MRTVKRRQAALALISLGVAGACAIGPAAIRTHASSPLAGPFHTSGTQILDAGNQPVIFKGIDWDGMQESWSYEFMQPSDVSQAALWNANLVRVELNEEFWNATCPLDPPTLKSTYRSGVENVVQDITSHGMVALLDLHVTMRGPCDGNDKAGAAFPSGYVYPMPDEVGGVPFWSSVAQTFAGNPLVAFELYNEPHPCPLAQAAFAPCPVPPGNLLANQLWEYGGQLTVAKQDAPSTCNGVSTTPANDTNCGYVTYAAAGMDELYTAVHQKAPQALVLIDANFGANSPTGFNPTTMFDTGTVGVYVEHVYAFDNSPGYPWTCAGIQGKVEGFDSAPGVDTHPVVVTEFGYPDPNQGGYDQAVVNELHGGLLAHLGREDGWAGFQWVGPNFSGLPATGFDLRILGATPTAYPDVSDATAGGAPVKAAMNGAYTPNC